jgi:hypothetical protein
VKRDTKQRDSLFQHPELQELQKPYNNAAASKILRRTAEYAEGFERRENAVAGVLSSYGVPKW